MRIEGCIPPMVTPVVDEFGDINRMTLRAYTEFLVDGGVHGLFPCGSTGEFTSLTRQQRRTVVQTVVETADDVPVLAGCGHTSIERVTTLIDDAAEAGADAAVVVTPYYLETSQASLESFYTRVADRAPLPIILYDIPSLTNRSLAVDTVAALATHDNIIGHKISVGDFLKFYELVQATPESFALLPGYPEMTIEGLNVGGNGVIAGPANVFPAAVADIYNAYTDGEYCRAIQGMKEIIFPVLSAIRLMPTIPALKYLIDRRGFDAGPALPPMPRLTETQKGALDALHDELRTVASVEQID